MHGGGRYLEFNGMMGMEGGRGGGVRLRVLELRDQGEPLYRDARMVPALETQVLRDPLQVSGGDGGGGVALDVVK